MIQLPLAADLMDRTFSTVKPTTRISEAVDILVKKRLTGVLVVDDSGDLVGVLSEKDCLKVLLYSGFHRFPDDPVSDYMTPDPVTVDCSTDIIRVAQIFLERDFRRLPVVEHGKLRGQITRRDIVKGMKRYFQHLS